MTEAAGAWVRVSSGGQDEANQVPDVEGYCASHGYEIAERYTVHGKSAYHGSQQAYLDEALADMRAGKIKVLVIWHSDRIERRPGKALLDVLAEFGAAGGRVESVKEPTLGQLDFGGQVTTFIAGLVNHEKSRHLSEQVGIAHTRIRENGALQGKPPWGYASEGSKYQREMVPTGEGRQYVPEIFSRCIAGDSLGTIATWLKVEGVLPPVAVSKRKRSGKDWWPGVLANLIRNPAYKGQRQDASGRTVHRCEALVDAATWRKAGETLAGKPKRGLSNAANRAMLTGVLFCPRCEDSPMYRIRAGVGGAYYYRCAGRGPQRKGCGNMVRLEHVDAEVNKTLIKVLDGMPVLATRITPGHDHEAEIEAVRDEMKQLVLQDLTDKEYDAELAKLRKERDRLAKLPSVPDKVEEVPTGEYYADLWPAITPAERGAWLAVHGFRITATKTAVKVSLPGHPQQAAA